MDTKSKCAQMHRRLSRRFNHMQGKQQEKFNLALHREEEERNEVKEENRPEDWHIKHLKATTPKGKGTRVKEFLKNYATAVPKLKKSANNRRFLETPQK